MPSEPVEKMASSVIGPEAGPPQDIPTHDTCPQRTMRVRTRKLGMIPGECHLHHREEHGGRLRWIISNISGTHERPLAVSPRGLR